jgi:hypothetical protein
MKLKRKAILPILVIIGWFKLWLIYTIINILLLLGTYFVVIESNQKILQTELQCFSLQVSKYSQSNLCLMVKWIKLKFFWFVWQFCIVWRAVDCTYVVNGLTANAAYPR